MAVLTLVLIGLLPSLGAAAFNTSANTLTTPTAEVATSVFDEQQATNGLEE